MHRHLSVMLIALGMVITPLTAQTLKQYRGTAPAISILDDRSEIDKLEDRVEDLEFENGQQQHQIDLLIALTEQLQVSLTAATEELSGIAALNDYIVVVDDDLIIEARDIQIVAEGITFDAEKVEATDELICEKLTADEVDADSYDPGAGNVW